MFIGANIYIVGQTSKLLLIKKSLFPEIQRIGEAFVIYDVHFCAADDEAHLGADGDFVAVGGNVHFQGVLVREHT